MFEDNKVEDVRASLESLTAVRENISGARGLVGARVNRLENARILHDRIATDVTAILSENEDVDLTKAIVSLQQEQDVFQAALASGNSLIPQSLMDFIG